MVKWLGKADKCDICRIPLKSYTEFIDGRTRRGPWALMCPPCHSIIGTGLGTGKGQLYDYETREKIKG